MRGETKKITIRLYISIAFIGLSSLSIAFIPLGDFSGNKNQLTTAYMIGAVFWIGILASYCNFVFMNRMRKRACRREKMRWPPKIGAITLFRNFYGMIADIICIISLIVSIILIAVNGGGAGWATFIAISVFVFSIQMHGILNGENFEYIQYQKKRGTKND